MADLGTIDLSEEQIELLNVATAFCRDKSPIKSVRALLEDETGYDLSAVARDHRSRLARHCDTRSVWRRRSDAWRNGSCHRADGPQPHGWAVSHLDPCRAGNS